MPSFAFAARDRSGRAHQGSIEAASPAAVVGDLRGRGWVVIEVHPEEAGDRSPSATLEAINPANWLPVRSSDIEVSARQMAVMLRSGLTLLNALQTVADQSPRAAMRRIWQDVSRRIQEGAFLADAMAEHPQFSQIVVQLVRVGEQTGHLEAVLTRAADTLEGRRQLRSQLLNALTYPAIVFVAAIGVTIFMMVSVIPKLQTFLAALGRQLPPLTQLLIDVTDFVNAHLVHAGIGFVFLAATVIVLRSWPPGRLRMNQYLLRVPVVGKLFRLTGTVLLARGLSTLIRSGVTLLEGLRTVERLIGNRYLAAQVAEARDAVMQGGALAETLETKYAFMPMLAGMVAVGESAGTLDEVLDEVARFYEDQLQRAIRRLAALVEPAIIVVVGGIVGFVYISFFMALFAAAGS